MVADFIEANINIILYIPVIIASLLLLMQYSVYGSPNYNINYEDHDIDLSKLDEATRRKVISSRQAIDVSIFLPSSIISVAMLVYSLLFLQYILNNMESGALSRFVDFLILAEGVIIVVMLFFTGFVAEHLYQIVLRWFGYDDFLSVLDKKFALYYVTIIVSFIVMDTKLFLLVTSIFMGKFVWIDSYISWKGRDLRKALREEIKRLKENPVRREIIRFGVAFLLSYIANNISYRVGFSNIIVAILPLIIIVAFYIVPFIRNMRSMYRGN